MVLGMLERTVERSRLDGPLRLNCFIVKFSLRHICAMEKNICKIFIHALPMFFQTLYFNSEKSATAFLKPGMITE